MSVDGTITEQHIAEEAEAGHTVTLTIDSNLQKVTEEALKKNIKDIFEVDSKIITENGRTNIYYETKII